MPRGGFGLSGERCSRGSRNKTLYGRQAFWMLCPVVLVLVCRNGSRLCCGPVRIPHNPTTVTTSHADPRVGWHTLKSLNQPQEQNLDGQPVVDGKVVTVAFPWDAVSDLGAVWNWSATTTVEGEDVDYCAEPGAEVLNPKMARFPTSPK